MKSFFIFVLIMFFIGIAGSYVGLRYFRSFTRQQLARNLPQSVVPSPTVVPTVAENNQSEVNALFVPYWSLTTKAPNFSEYNEFIYFGVTAKETGLDTTEAGYTNLAKFIKRAENAPRKSLTLRMIDSSIDLKILADTAKQSAIIAQIVSLAKQNNFYGVVLDLEVSAIPFDSLVKQITIFNQALSAAAKQQGLQYSVMIYGDAFYRLRPFDVKAIASSADRVMVMAYDFSKAGSNPGPDFPLSGKETYGYDYSKMTADFLQAVPKEKLAVTFGMFGYDWPVSADKKASGSATAITTKEAMDTLVTNCKEKTCDWKKDNDAQEIKVNYVTKDDSKHIVWFESTDSAKLKKEYLKQRGITHFGYWANSYF